MKRDAYGDNPIFSQSEFDSPANLRKRGDRRREKMIEIWRDPIWSRLSRILLISMLALSAAMLLVECKAAKTMELDWKRFLNNVSVTLLWVWGVHAALIALCAAFGARRNRREYRRRMQESGIEDTTAEEIDRGKRAVRRLNADFARYARIAGIGLLALIVFRAAVRFLIV